MYVDTDRIVVRQIRKAVAKDFIVKHHYSHRFSSCRYALGVYYKNDSHPFFDGPVERLIGALTYGHPVGAKTVNSIVTDVELQLDEVLELTRLVVLDEYGTNTESYVIGQSFRWLRQNDDKVKVLVSYADGEWDHTGTIYQATNWIYQGYGLPGRLPGDYSIKEHPDAPWMHSRSVGAKWGLKNVEILGRTIGHTFWRKEELPKHRYLYFLGSKSDKKRLMKNLKYPSVPYSESTKIKKPKIERVEIIDDKIHIFDEIGDTT